MKITRIICFLAFVGLLISCNKSDNNTALNQLNGEWNLVMVTCECETISLEAGQNIWLFNVQESKLEVTNNVTEQLHTIPETGMYDIVLAQNKVTFKEVVYDYYFENGKLFLADHPELDGPLIEFVRD